ncbi:MAG: SGNH/GDSL hydrolase family protein [Pyrinomonadaceae bacterium]
MKKRLYAFLLVCAGLAVFSVQADAQLNIQAIDVAGDSISKGVNAGGAPCANADQEQYNWITGDTHGVNFCSAGSENVYSVLERLECDYQTNIFTALPNHAASGARMLSDFLAQAGNIKTYLNSQPAPRMAAVFLGHNDNCSGTITKTNASCSNSDLDPNNYCRTKNDAFEREFRKGLEVLMSIPNTRIAVAAPVRVSQLCNFQNKANCQAPISCQVLWSNVNICGSLTQDCSPARIADTYKTMKAYRDILKNVTAEYAAIADGGTSRVVTIGGEIIGGGIKASGAAFIYSDAAWRYRFNADQLSCCDCFHPSAIGQDKLAQIMKNGLTCSPIQPCCRDTGDPLVDGKCSRRELKRISYNGLF